jgi:hypothetical protein
LESITIDEWNRAAREATPTVGRLVLVRNDALEASLRTVSLGAGPAINFT